MSHLGRHGPPDIMDTYSLLVLNVSFRTTADDLYTLFDKYGKVIDVHIPRDRRTGESRGFAFVRYKYEDEAQKAVDRLDGRVVDGREIAVQFAKYGPNAERIYRGRVIEKVPRSKYRSRSPPRRERDYRRSHSRSYDRYDHDRGHGRRQEYHYRSRSRSVSAGCDRGYGHSYDREQSRSQSYDSLSPSRRNGSPRRSISPRKIPHQSPVRQSGTLRSLKDQPVDSRSPS